MNLFRRGRNTRQIPVLIATGFCLLAAPSLAYVLPDSDQRTCYQSVSPFAQIPCAGTGQDGAYIRNPLNYTDNGNGTVTDNNTDLVWQKEDDGGTYNWYRAAGIYNTTHNPESTNVCGSLNLGGATDWRLPSIKELLTIADCEIQQPGPTIHPVFTNTKSDHYRTSYMVETVNFYDSRESFIYPYDPHSVRCVRGERISAPTLTDNGNGTVTDSRTGLIWQQGEPGAATWGIALKYCEMLNLGGSVAWRLPNIKELQSLDDETKSNPSVDKRFFPGIFSSFYWTSSTYASDPGYAWWVHFDSGIVEVYNKDYVFYVRCVQGGQADVSGGDLVPGVAGLDVIANAVDQNAWTFTTTAGANWWWQAGVTHDGQDAARSGYIADGQASSFQTTGNFSAGTVSFWWKVSSESTYDILRLSIDGVVRDEISGEVDWEYKSGYPLTAGSHTLKWEYSKDGSIFHGEDAAWVDQLVLPAAQQLVPGTLSGTIPVGGLTVEPASDSADPPHQIQQGAPAGRSRSTGRGTFIVP